MTHIANYPTKKAFKEAVKANPEKVYLDDPSMFDPVSGSVAVVMARKGMVTVTNHPKRSWFACIKRNEKDLTFKVE